jgi:hypothetical protein
MAPAPPTTSIWSNIVAIVLTPIVVWLLAVGWGLLIERIARVELPKPVSAGVGFCAAVVVALGIYELGVGDPITVPAVAAPALVGLVLCGRKLPGHLNGGWPLVAALAAYVLCDLSVIASGHWTLTFYNIDNDSAYELVLIAHLRAHGTHSATGMPSTAHTVIQAYLSTGYPLGGQSLLGVVSGLLGVSAAVVWQGFMSSMIGIATLVASAISGRTMGPRAAAAAALLALLAALTFQYTLQGSIKEITTLVGILAALAVMRYGLVTRTRTRTHGVVPIIAVPLAAILAAYNAAGVPYVGALIAAGVLALFALYRPIPQVTWLKPVLSGIAVLVVLAVPALVTLRTFLSVSVAGYSGSHPTAPNLGPLLRPLPLSEISGVWLVGDYRLPVPQGAAGGLTAAVTVLVLVLVALGVWRAVRAREPGPLMGLFVVALVLLIVYPRITPYAQAKLLAIGSPIVLLGALQGLTGLRRQWARVLAMAPALVLAGTVLASDALAYHVAPTLPTDRMLALEQIGRRLGHKGPVLDSEFEQFAKYFMFPTPVIDGPDSPTPVQLALRTPTNEYDKSFDLNEEKLGFIEAFPYVLTRRSAVTSRPPANYRLVLENAFYDLWRRTETPRVLADLPVGGSGLDPNVRPDCSALRSLVRHAPRSARLAVWKLPSVSGFSMANARTRSPGWSPDGLTATPGVAEASVLVRRAGLDEIWVQGNLTRRVEVRLDGRRIGSAQGSNTPGGWVSAGYVRVTAGRHSLSVLRGRAGLSPGDGSTTASVAAVALSAAVPPPAPALVSLGDWRGLCRQPASWIEVVRP